MMRGAGLNSQSSLKGHKMALLAAGSLVAIALTSPAAAQTVPAAAATADAQPEITIMGFRASLKSAQDAKRNDIRVTDGVSAEDIGKFPAQNITEAIQRISGVQMSNINGRGSTISIRGLGNQYARTTINGQTFASADFKDGFRYDIIQTDLASAIQVIKSPTADMDTGGLSGTVNIDTVKPLTYKGPSFIFGVKGYGSDYRKSFTPKVSGAYIGKFAGDTLAVMANVSYQKLKDRGDYLFIKNWYDPGVVAGAPDVTVPGNLRFRRIDRDTEQLRRALDRPVTQRHRRIPRVPEHRHASGRRHSLPQDLEPLGAQHRRLVVDACDVSARAGQACDKAGLDHVAGIDDDDWKGACRSLRSSGCGRSLRNDQVDPQAQDVGDKPRQFFRLRRGPPALVDDVLALVVAQLLQRFPQDGRDGPVRGARRAGDETNAPDLARSRLTGGRTREAEDGRRHEAVEVAPFHGHAPLYQDLQQPARIH